VSTQAPTHDHIEKCFSEELGGSHSGSALTKFVAHKLDNGETIELRMIVRFEISWRVTLEDAKTSGWTFSVDDEVGARRDLFAFGRGEVFTLEGGEAATHTLVLVGVKKVCKLCKEVVPMANVAGALWKKELDKEVGHVFLGHILASDDPVADFNLTTELSTLHKECKTVEASIVKDNDRMSEIKGCAAMRGHRLDLRASKAGLDVKMNVYITAVKAFAEEVAISDVDAY
jgi:hypothetical protein